MVIPTPQFVKLPLHAKYKGEGEPLLHGDPPIPVMGHLPCPLGRSVPRNTKWYDMCPLEDTCFRELHKLAKATPPAERTQEMNVTFRRVQAQRSIDNQTGLGLVLALLATLSLCSRAGGITPRVSHSRFTANRMGL
jgi:hypothetical protein